MADREKLLQLKEERAQLINEQQDLLAQIEAVNEEIAGKKKTATYQKWKQLYERAMNEVNREKKSSNMNMDRYQTMMKEVKKMKKAYPLADVMKKKSDLENRLAEVSSKIAQNKKDVKVAKVAKVEKSPVKKEEAPKESVVDVNTAKIGALAGLRQMAELQAHISRIQATERIKKITDVVADLSVNVDAKINLAVMSYRKYRGSIEAAKGEYEVKINEIVDRFRDNMVLLEEAKQAVEQKEAECLAKLATKNDEIEFRKKDVEYKKWAIQYKKNSAQIKKLKGSKNMDMDTYQRLLKEHTELKAKNPLNRNMAECKELAENLAQIREQLAEKEQQKKEFFNEQLQAFAEATRERDNKLVLSEKKGAFKRFIGGLADKINSKKRVESSVVAPLKQLTERLGRISATLEDKKTQYMEELTPLMGGQVNEEQKSITEVIQNGQNRKEGIIEKLKKKIQEGKTEITKEPENEPVVHVQKLMEFEV